MAFPFRMDRLEMVTTLGRLAGESTLRGDDRAAADLRGIAGHLMAVHADLLKLEDRRRRDRGRHRKPSAVSAESAESTENVEKSVFPPDPLFPKRTNEESTRAGLNGKQDSALLDRIGARLAQEMGDLWPDADAFVKRRQSSTWLAWLREMLAVIGPGSQYVPADLALVCRDDGALDRPIGSPKGLRVFLASARAERLNPEPPEGIPKMRSRGPIDEQSQQLASLAKWAKDNA